MNREDIKFYIIIISSIFLSAIFVEDRYAKQEQIRTQQDQIKEQSTQIKAQEKLINKQNSQMLYTINTLSEENRKKIQQMLDIEDSMNNK